MTDYWDNAPATQSPGKMAGFDPEFHDLIDYIERITYRIWEGKQVGLCLSYYSGDCPVFTLGGYTEGAEEVMQNTMATLQSFPDRRLITENIIWGGNDKDGFHSSHLIWSPMTNLGPSTWGKETGRKANIFVIAHCVCKNNQVIQEWLVRDNLGLALQLGFDPKDLVEKKIKDLNGRTPREKPWLDAQFNRIMASQNRVRLNYPEQDKSFDLEQFIKVAMHNIVNVRMIGDCRLLYDENATMIVSGRPEICGIDEIIQFHIKLLESLPDCNGTVDYICSNSRNEGEHVAVRWTLAGTHKGLGLWGTPSAAPVVVLAESHFKIRDRKVIKEWMVFDELAVLTQIALFKQSSKKD